MSGRVVGGRALVVGAWHTPLASGGPSSADVDAERMAALLEARGFEVCLLRGPDATRDRILGGYLELIGKAAKDRAAGKVADAPVVVFFSGHGGYRTDLPAEDVAEVDPEEPPVPEVFRFIAPQDYRQSDDGDFRGISSWELSLLQEGLTRETRNVTVILDCCHAGQMSRGGKRGQAKDGDTESKRSFELTRSSIRRHMRAVRARPDVLGQLARTAELCPTGNPNAVRLVACGAWSSAFPTTDAQGRATGMLTDALIATLEEIGEVTVPWRAIGAAIRERVRQRTSRQLPFIEGPLHRRLFSLEEVSSAWIPIASREGGLVLEAGRISGVSVGDVYGVTRFDAPRLEPATEIARIRVEQVAALHAVARQLEWRNGHASLPERSIAWPLELAIARQPVRVVAPERARQRLEVAVSASPRLRVAAAGERAIAELRLGDELELRVEDGTRLYAIDGAWSEATAIRQLQDLATAQSLRELQGEGLSRGEVEVEWGTDQKGVRTEQLDGADIDEGEQVYIRIHNRSDHVRYAHVFNLGPRGTISRLSDLCPTGILMGAGETHPVGAIDEATFEATWPEGVQRDVTLIDELVVIVTTAPADLGVLETSAARPKGGLRSGTSLQRLLAHLHQGGTRRTGGLAPERFLVVHRWWRLHPNPSPALSGSPDRAAEDPPDQPSSARTRSASQV